MIITLGCTEKARWRRGDIAARHNRIVFGWRRFSPFRQRRCFPREHQSRFGQNGALVKRRLEAFGRFFSRVLNRKRIEAELSLGGAQACVRAALGVVLRFGSARRGEIKKGADPTTLVRGDPSNVVATDQEHGVCAGLSNQRTLSTGF